MFGPFLPTAVQNAIQQNFLQRGFIDPLLNKLAYREITDKEMFKGRIGYTITKTRMGLMVPNTTPLDPNTNTNIDNGLNPQNYSDEQYTLSINQYPQVAPNVNLMDDEVSIASFMMANSERLGMATATAVDRLTRATLFNAYMSGNTFLTATATSTTLHVDDIRGFQTVVVNGNVEPVGVSNPLPVYVNGVLKLVTAASADATNISTALITGGISGSLTFSTSVAGTAGQAVVGQYAPLIVRPNARATTAAIQSTDLFNMKSILAAVSYLRNNNVPKIRGRYNCFLNSTSMNQLFQDTEFQLLNRGVSTRDPVYRDAEVYEFLDVRLIQTTETYVQDAGLSDGSVTVAQSIQRPIVCGAGAMVEGIFDPGMDAIEAMSRQGGIGITELNSGGGVSLLDSSWSKRGFYYHVRPPIDRLAQIVSQTSNYVGGFVVPTDVTTNPLIIPTASRAYFKRAVIIETAS
jgi:hypothetical protein